MNTHRDLYKKLSLVVMCFVGVQSFAADNQNNKPESWEAKLFWNFIVPCGVVTYAGGWALVNAYYQHRKLQPTPAQLEHARLEAEKAKQNAKMAKQNAAIAQIEAPLRSEELKTRQKEADTKDKEIAFLQNQRLFEEEKFREARYKQRISDATEHQKILELCLQEHPDNTERCKSFEILVNKSLSLATAMNQQELDRIQITSNGVTFS